MSQEQVEITFRDAIPTDAEKLIELINTLNQESTFIVVDQLSEISIDDEAHMISEIYHSDSNALILALANDVPVGLIRVSGLQEEHMEHTAEIGIAVKKEMWNFGIGSQLMEIAIEIGVEDYHFHRYQLTVQEKNKAAVHLYEKFGFEKEGLMVDAYQTSPNQYENVLMMAKLFK